MRYTRPTCWPTPSVSGCTTRAWCHSARSAWYRPGSWELQQMSLVCPTFDDQCTISCGSNGQTPHSLSWWNHEKKHIIYPSWRVNQPAYKATTPKKDGDDSPFLKPHSWNHGAVGGVTELWGLRLNHQISYLLVPQTPCFVLSYTKMWFCWYLNILKPHVSCFNHVKSKMSICWYLKPQFFSCFMWSPSI